MKKISGNIFFIKKVFPVIWFGFLAFFLVIAITTGAPAKNPAFLLMPLFMTTVGFVLMKKLVWPLMDEVIDGGDYLLVKNRGEQDMIYLKDIMNISASTMTNPPSITLRLRKPSKFGNEVVFSPIRPFSLNPFQQNAVAEDLIVRVDAARLQAR